MRIVLAAARTLGIAHPVPVRTPPMTGAELVAAVQSLGGTIDPGSPFSGWYVAVRPRDEVDAISRFAPALVGAHLNADDFEGIAEIALENEGFVVLRTSERVWPGVLDRIQVLAGPSLEATLRLATALERAREYLSRRRPRLFGTAASLATWPRVAEADLVLPKELKRSLLEDIDTFWHTVDWGQWQVPPSRGVLLLGGPGTGKTVAIQHLLARQSRAQVHIFLPDDGPVAARHAFRGMIQELLAVGAPATVVLEDLDWLLAADLVPLELLMNVLDGLVRLPQPVLWLATATDPRLLEPRLLDRPGRLDRVFVFPLPGPAELARLFTRFAPWPLAAELVAELAREGEGLSGAHVREVCQAAARAIADRAGEDAAAHARALRAALGRVHAEHSRAQGLAFTSDHPILGFARRRGPAEATPGTDHTVDACDIRASV